MASALTASLVRAPFTTSKGEAGPKPCLQAQRVVLFPVSVRMRTAGPSNMQLKASQRRGSAVYAQEGTTETAQGAGVLHSFWNKSIFRGVPDHSLLEELGLRWHLS